MKSIGNCLNPVGKIFECRINKNALLQTAFWQQQQYHTKQSTMYFL